MHFVETVLPDSTTDDEESKSNTPHMNKAMDRLDSLIDRMEGFKKKGFLETPVKALDETPVNSTTYSGDIMKKEKGLYNYNKFYINIIYNMSTELFELMSFINALIMFIKYCINNMLMSTLITALIDL